MRSFVPEIGVLASSQLAYPSEVKAHVSFSSAGVSSRLLLRLFLFEDFSEFVHFLSLLPGEFLAEPAF